MEYDARRQQGLDLLIFTRKGAEMKIRTNVTAGKKKGGKKK
jgi:hypothetical protein